MARPNKQSMWVGVAFCAVALITAPRTAMAAAPDSSPEMAADPIGALLRLSAREADDAKQLKDQAALIAQQADELAKTKALIEAQQRQLDAMKLATADLQSIRAAGTPDGGAGGRDLTAIDEIQGGGPDAGGSPAGGPVGEAPPVHPNAQVALALPQGIDVLTPKGRLIFDNALEYQDSSSDRLVFSGIQIVDAFQIGVLQATTTSNDSGLVLNTLRYGLGDRWEIEGTVPWVGRTDHVTTVQTVTGGTNLTRTFNISGAGIGDVEGTVRYQITDGSNGLPIFLGALRVVSDSGIGPFNVPYNATGVAEKLPTGSGFWVINPTLTAIYPLDPIVVFGSVGYQHSFGHGINKTFGTVPNEVNVGSAQPGDGISAAAGFAFSLNSHFSYSLGYKESYFLPSTTIFLPSTMSLGVVKARTLAVNDGVLLAGASYRIDNHASINLNFEFGVTPDAPNDTILIRVPYLF
jgi:hypothetical protein